MRLNSIHFLSTPESLLYWGGGGGGQKCPFAVVEAGFRGFSKRLL